MVVPDRTGRERVTALLQGNLINQPVVFPLVVANHAARLARTPLHLTLTRPDVLAQVLFAAYQHYRYDLVMVFSDVLVEAEAMGCQVAIPHDDAPVLLEPADEAGLEPADPEASGRMPVVLEATERLKELVGNEVFVVTSLKGPFSLASFLAGTERFLTDLLEEPSRAHRFLKAALENQRRFVRAIVNRGGVPFIGDPMASGSIISPTMFQEFAEPYLTALVQEIHHQRSWTGLHICGDSSAILPMMRETGADVLSIDEMDMNLVRKRLGPKTVVMGNVSTSLLLEGTPEQVRTAAHECLKRGLPSLVLSSACDVPVDAPSENVRALVQVAREWQA
ncbi:MAG: uroporphyrinogen decarboxylase family protein [candidate division WOR-3 bacterium]